MTASLLRPNKATHRVRIYLSAPRGHEDPETVPEDRKTNQSREEDTEVSLNEHLDHQQYWVKWKSPWFLSQNWHGPSFVGQCSEAVVSERRRRSERTEAEAPVRMDPLFGAVERPADAHPTQVYERRVGRVQRRHPQGQIGTAVGGAGRRARGGERGREGVKGRGVVRVHSRVDPQIEGITVRGREGVTVCEGVCGRGLVGQARAAGAANDPLGGRSVRYASRYEAPRVDAGAVRGRTWPRDDVDLQTPCFRAPQSGVWIQGERQQRLVLGLKRVLTQRKIQH